MDKMKLCKTCEVEQPLDGFHKNKKSKDGLQSNCKSCCSAYMKKYSSEHNLYEKYKDSHKLSNKKWLDNKGRDWFKAYFKTYVQEPRNRQRKCYASAKLYRKWYRSTDRGKLKERYHYHKRRCKIKSGNVTTEELKTLLEQSRKCFYCDKLLNGKYHMDHYVPLSKGGLHTIDNIVIACPKCNLTKGSKLPHLFTPCQWTK